jgi:hypothetical protein
VSAPVAQCVDSKREVDIRYGVAASKHVALRQESRDIAGESFRANLLCAEQHVSEARVDRQAGHRPAAPCDASACIEGLELGQHLDRLRERGRRRWIEPRELERVGDAGRGEIECQRRQVGVQDFGRRLIEKVQRLVLVPEAIAHTGCQAAGASAPLIGRRLRHAYGVEPRHADRGREARYASPSRVDHDANTFDREARFGDRRREHDLAAALRVRPDRAILRIGAERAVQRRHDRIERPFGEQ